MGRREADKKERYTSDIAIDKRNVKKGKINKKEEKKEKREKMFVGKRER